MGRPWKKAANLAETPVEMAVQPTRGGYSARWLLQHVGGVVRQPRALASREGHVAGVTPVLHAVDDVGEARAALGEVRRIDLRDVAQAHHLGAGAGPRD